MTVENQETKQNTVILDVSVQKPYQNYKMHSTLSLSQSGKMAFP